MPKEIRILKHQGKKKNYYTVHSFEDGEYMRIYGKFSSIGKAKKRANMLANKMGLTVRVDG